MVALYVYSRLCWRHPAHSAIYPCYYYFSTIERIQILQKLRLEDEERRKKELQEKQRKEKLDLELRKKREAGMDSFSLC